MASYTFYYNAQIRKYVSQFLRIFAGFQTQDGVDRDNNGANDYRSVNIVYGDIDRVIGAVLQNQSESFVSQKIPMISAYLSSISLDSSRRTTRFHDDNVAYPISDGSGAATVERTVGTPVNLGMELNVYASNTDQLFQIVEQILLLFNPTLQIQRSSEIADWSYISKVELQSINNQQNFPIGTGRRIYTWSLSFLVEAWINYPLLEGSGIIEQITANITDETISVPGVALDTITINSSST